MLFIGSKFGYADNSGAKTMQCVRILGGSNKKVANVGNMIKVVVKQLRSKKKSK